MNAISTDAMLWGAVRWVAVVAVIVGLFFLRSWLRRIGERGASQDRAGDGEGVPRDR